MGGGGSKAADSGEDLGVEIGTFKGKYVGSVAVARSMGVGLTGLLVKFMRIDC